MFLMMWGKDKQEVEKNKVDPEHFDTVKIWDKPANMQWENEFIY